VSAGKAENRKQKAGSAQQQASQASKLPSFQAFKPSSLSLCIYALCFISFSPQLSDESIPNRVNSTGR
jgi:hypothetical protein